MVKSIGIASGQRERQTDEESKEVPSLALTSVTTYTVMVGSPEGYRLGCLFQIAKNLVWV